MRFFGSAGGVGVSTGTLGKILLPALARRDRCGKLLTAKIAKKIREGREENLP
jgi:hypothetical protein